MPSNKNITYKFCKVFFRSRKRLFNFLLASEFVRFAPEISPANGDQTFSGSAA